MKTILLAIVITLFLIGNAFATAGITDPFRVSIPSGGSTYAKTVYVSATTNGDNTIITAVAGKRLKIWEFSCTARILTSIYFMSASTQITQAVQLMANGSWTGVSTMIYDQVSPALVTNIGEGLILKTNTTGPIDVWVKYTEE